MMDRKRLSFAKALLWIVISMFTTTGVFYSFFYPFKDLSKEVKKETKNRIVSIIQTGPEKEALPTVCLAEILNLSCDCEVSLDHFDIEEATKKLLAVPVIKEAKIKKVFPETLYIDYTIRHPIASLYDFENVAIDEEGYLFPLVPFFSPKNLPEVYIGLSPFGVRPQNPLLPTAEWGRSLESPPLKLALNILKLLKEGDLSTKIGLRRIDVSHAFKESFGSREVVLFCEDEITHKHLNKEAIFLLPRLLRLSTKDYSQDLGNYLKLREELLKLERKELKIPQDELLDMELKDKITLIKTSEKMIDFRIPHLAFIEVK
ncbi:MAG: cell division protein FtsQ/DivIB [Anaerolineae bacterium]